MEPLTVAQLIEKLKRLPPDVPVYLDEPMGPVREAWLARYDDQPAVFILRNRVGVLSHAV